jgi:hypothetical protein
VRQVVAVLAVTLLTLILACAGAGPTSTPGTTKRPKPTPEVQEQRRQVIMDLIVKGVFARLEVEAGVPVVYVGRTFYALSWEDKAALVSVVYALHFDGPDADELTNEVLIRDALTGARRGAYGPAHGGLSLD